jgi:hypothetical protein
MKIGASFACPAFGWDASCAKRKSTAKAVDFNAAALNLENRPL